MSSYSERIAQIRSHGYWRVNFRPHAFDESRISTLSECRSIVQGCTVSLRGWDYPHWSRDETINGQDWVESGSEWHTHAEYWRFYQSTQFIHNFAVGEDYEFPGKNVLSVISTLYSFTEIFEFLSRLGARELYTEGVDVTVELNNTEGRKLVLLDPNRVPLMAEYRCGIESVVVEYSLSYEEVINRGGRSALDATRFVFERFHWDNPPMDSLVEDQTKLLEKRF